MFGYDFKKHHGKGPFGRNFFYHVDFPRIKEARVSGAMWSVTTNPFKSSGKRKSSFLENYKSLKQALSEDPEGIAIARSHGEYLENYKSGKHSAFMVIQGGNSIESYDSINETIFNFFSSAIFCTTTCIKCTKCIW
mgnify:CR=1 FL=1